MNQELVQAPDIIWRFHINPSNNKLYLECKTEHNEFYLWDTESKAKWTFPALDKHTSNILQVQYPYVLLTYMNTDNLMNNVVLMCYDLERQKEHWSSSEIKLESCYLGVLKVYSAKVSPKRYEYINFNNEKLEAPLLEEISLDVLYSEKENDKHFIEHNGNTYEIRYLENEHQLELTIHKENKVIHNYKAFVDDYNFEYDYLIRIGDKVLVLIDKQQILILQ